jgi:hypothetical protein
MRVDAQSGEEGVRELGHPDASRVLFPGTVPRLTGKRNEFWRAGSCQITIRVGNKEIALTKKQADAKARNHQTYIKMLLYGALAWPLYPEKPAIAGCRQRTDDKK